VVIGQQLNTRPPSIAGRRPELAGLDPVIAKALAKDPDDRFSSCADFARALATDTRTARSAARTSALTVPAIAKGPAPTAALPVTSQSVEQPMILADRNDRRRVGPLTFGVLIALLFLTAVVLVVRPWQHGHPTDPATENPTSLSSSITFDGMREFVANYYGLLPGRATEAWTKLDTRYQTKPGATIT
jgi:serine/threonine-protein kinase